jgi:hypothetical protein
LFAVVVAVAVAVAVAAAAANVLLCWILTFIILDVLNEYDFDEIKHSVSQ